MDKCPKCGAKGTMKYGDVYQVCREYHIKRDGSISKRGKLTPMLSEEWNYIACSNCGLYMVGHDYPTYGFIDGKIVIDEEYFDREDEIDG